MWRKENPAAAKALVKGISTLDIADRPMSPIGKAARRPGPAAAKAARKPEPRIANPVTASCQFYHGRIPKQQAEALLLDKEGVDKTGKFLMRAKSEEAGEFVLSVIYKLSSMERRQWREITRFQSLSPGGKRSTARRLASPRVMLGSCV